MLMLRRSASLIVLSACLILIPLTAAAQEEALVPEWGSAVSIKTVAGPSFVPVNLFTVQNMGVGITGNGTVCNDFSGGTCRFSSGVDLPSGARIVGLDLMACDGAAGGAAVLILNECPTVGSCPVTPTASVTSGGGNCVTSSAALNITVQNGTNYYPLFVNITDNSIGVLFKGVRIRYQLQVSAAPATATFPNDVPTSHPFFRFVEAMAASGLTGGCAPGSFCPDNPVTRGQLSVFLASALGMHFPN